MRTRWMMLSALIALSGGLPAQAQDEFFIFPQFVDGRFSDGTYYRSTLMVQQWLSTGNVNCALRLGGMTATLGTSTGNSFTFTIPRDGWFMAKTPGTQAFQSGYAALTCDDYVFANVGYAFYSPTGTKIGEATVFGVDPTFSLRLIADQTEGARLGIAVANDTDIQRTYTLILRRADGSTATSSNITVGARRALAKFLDEIIPSSVGQTYEVEVYATDFTDMSAMGLRFTGSTFSTIPAN